MNGVIRRLWFKKNANQVNGEKACDDPTDVEYKTTLRVAVFSKSKSKCFIVTCTSQHTF